LVVIVYELRVVVFSSVEEITVIGKVVVDLKPLTLLGVCVNVQTLDVLVDLDDGCTVSAGISAIVVISSPVDVCATAHALVALLQ